MKNLLVIMSLLCLFSCKKDPVPEPDPTVETGTFLMHLHTYIDLEEVDLYGIDYQTLNGRTISLDLAQLYISDIQFVRPDGSVYNATGKNILKTLETDTYAVGDVPVGTYKSLRFKVGLAPAVNALAPKASADSLILNQPAMWFGNTAQPDGYVFLHVQGKIDTSADLSHPPVPFNYKIGTNAHYVQVNMSEKNFVVTKGNAAYGHIIVDYSKLFNGVVLNQAGNLSVTTVAENDNDLAKKIANNIPAMFIYE